MTLTAEDKALLTKEIEAAKARKTHHYRFSSGDPLHLPEAVFQALEEEGSLLLVSDLPVDKDKEEAYRLLWGKMGFRSVRQGTRVTELYRKKKEAKIPGRKASHSIITPECRSGRGQDGAWKEAVRRVEQQYHLCCKNWGDRANLHLVLVVEPRED